jgi:mannan endo-1,4-beta-mannosidase
MKSRIPLIVAVLLAMVAVGYAGSRLAGSVSDSPAPAHASLTPKLASYLGTFEPGAPPGYGPIASFARMVNRQPNIVGYYSGWTQPFDMAFAKTLQAHGVVPFVEIDPTASSIDGIANGIYDDYLRSYADSVRNFRHAVIIGFGHEMNATWYPWGYKRVPAATFVGAWRHIVTLFRREGAENVTWLWTLEADQPGTGPIASWWPGASYVDWVGIDGYYYRPADTFTSVFGTTITQVRAFTNKPVLLSETAVGPAAFPFAKIPDLFHGMTKYKTLGLVWFDKAQHGDVFHQDWRLADNVQAQISFRLGVHQMAPYHPIGIGAERLWLSRYTESNG